MKKQGRVDQWIYLSAQALLPNACGGHEKSRVKMFIGSVPLTVALGVGDEVLGQ